MASKPITSEPTSSSGRRVVLQIALKPIMPTDTADLIIWDSTPAGLTAAIAGTRAGLRVIVVTEDKHLGGVQTSGLGFTNAGQTATIGGLTASFHQRICQYYTDQYGEQSQQVRDCNDGYYFEPHVAETVWETWLREAGVTCVRQAAIKGVDKTGSRIAALRTADGRRFVGKVFIDASYEGDLLAAAGCSYHLGREARTVYDESMAGATYPPDRAGAGDRKLQPFDYRCCLTNVANNRVPFTEPAGYDPKGYEWLLWKFRQAKVCELKYALPINWMPNGKTDSRTAEWPRHSWDYIEADRARRGEIERAHRQYSAGYLWFLMTDSAVPQSVRDEAEQWGLAKDEFTDNDHWPWHIYVREGRRLVGDYVMTQRDCLEDRFKPDSIAVCSWYLDVHPVEVMREGDTFHADGIITAAVKPFEIPWRSVLPHAAEVDNLLVPVALSASHVGYSAIRVEPVWMILGESCGIGAAMSLEDDRPLHQVDANPLRQRLQDHGQIIDAQAFDEVWPQW